MRPWMVLALPLAVVALAFGARLEASAQAPGAAQTPGDRPAAGPLPTPQIRVLSQGGFTVTPCREATCRGNGLFIPPGDSLAPLRAALVRLRAAYPRLPAVRIAPDHDVPWDRVVKVMDAARRQADGQPLFPVLFLGREE
jgi:hypothetical protein